MGTHVLYEITQCYLPSGRGDIPYPNQLKLVLETEFIYLAWLHTNIVYPCKDE